MGPQVSAFLERSVVAEAALIHLGLVRLVMRLRLDNMAAVVVVRQLVLGVNPARETIRVFLTALLKDRVFDRIHR